MATGGGMVTSMNAPPCRTADTVMGPKISPPGKPSRNRPSAVAVEAPTKSAKATGASAMVVGFAGSRTDAGHAGERQRGRHHHGEDDHPQGLHDGDAADIAVASLLGGERHHLGKPARHGGEDRRQPAPAMNLLKVGDGCQRRGGDRNHHHGDAERPRRDAAQSCRRHSTAERDSKYDRTAARERCRDLNGAARKRRNRGEYHGAGEPAGRKFRGIEQEAADRPDQQRGGEAGELAGIRCGMHAGAINAAPHARRQTHDAASRHPARVA